MTTTEIEARHGTILDRVDAGTVGGTRECLARELADAPSPWDRATAGLDGEPLLANVGPALARRPIIETMYVYPPIPTDAFDWQATLDDFDGAPDAGWQPHGFGRTEDEAIEELLVNMEDHDDPRAAALLSRRAGGGDNGQG